MPPSSKKKNMMKQLVKRGGTKTTMRWRGSDLLPQVLDTKVKIARGRRLNAILQRHARSKKLLEEGRLKLMLNSDGEIEDDVETHAERHARTIAIAQKAAAPKKNSGRQRQSKRRREKSLAGKLSKADPSATIPAKKKHKVKSQ